MADDDALRPVTFRVNHLVRLHGFTNDDQNIFNLNGNLVRVQSRVDGPVADTFAFDVVFLDDQAHPPVPVVPERRMVVTSEHMDHVCETCFHVGAGGRRLQMCGRCKTSRYCNAECQRADWARHKSPDCFHFSHTRGRDTPLQQACMVGDATEVQRLVEVEGADMNRSTTNGPTPLCTAAWYGQMSVVRYLVEKGANKDKARVTSVTPMCVAAEKGFIQIVRYLVEQGADKEKAHADGRTPLYISVQNGHAEVVQCLVELGADKDHAADDGTTPLVLAAQNGHMAVVEGLLELGADKERATHFGMTPLMGACAYGHVDVAEYLLDRGCDRDSACINGWTALHWAARHGHLDVAHVLFRYGAKLDALDDGGRTPADLAIANGHHDVANAIRAEEIRRRDHGFKRDRSTIEGTEEHEAAKRPRVEVVAVEGSEGDDDDDDDDEEEEEEEEEEA